MSTGNQNRAQVWVISVLTLMAAFVSSPLRAADESWKSTSDQPPRKVIVGTVMQPFWGKQPPLEKRLADLTEIVDRMQAQSEKQYGRGVDLAVLPEVALTGQGEDVGEVWQWSYPLEGPIQDTFSRQARQYHCYIVVPLYLLEDKATKRCSNAAVLFGRQGEIVGIYRKVQLVVDLRTGALEHGATPGKEEPVFDCDFGKLGIQICFDMDFDYGWRELARKGAEIVVWPSQSPQTSRPAHRAIEGHYYIVSSTWQNNASVFDPVGKIVAQVKWDPRNGNPREIGGRLVDNDTLVDEIDLSYAIIGYSRALKNGELFTKTFGDKAGYHYYQDDERGVFWSNDPHMTIRQMLRSVNLKEEEEEHQLISARYHEAGIPGY
jgi:predicted amidohydrolase